MRIPCVGGGVRWAGLSSVCVHSFHRKSGVLNPGSHSTVLSKECFPIPREAFCTSECRFDGPWQLGARGPGLGRPHWPAKNHQTQKRKKMTSRICQDRIAIFPTPPKKMQFGSESASDRASRCNMALGGHAGLGLGRPCWTRHKKRRSDRSCLQRSHPDLSDAAKKCSLARIQFPSALRGAPCCC
eukprot:gene14187-biopygen11135